MKRLQIAVVILLFLVTGCSDKPVGPIEQNGVTQTESNTPETLAKVIQTETYEQFSLEGVTEYIECLGEWTEWHGYSDYWLVTTETPSGNVILHLKLNYDTDEPQWAESPSGPWVLLNAEDISHTVYKPKGTQVVDHFEANEIYENENGAKLHLRASWNFVLHADGTVTVDRGVWDWSCN